MATGGVLAALALLGCGGAPPAPEGPRPARTRPVRRPPPPRPSPPVPAVPPAAAELPESDELGSGPLGRMLRADLGADRAFPWSGARPLAWSDFRATPPNTGPQGAMTAYTLYFAWRCVGESFEFQAVAGFRTYDSWVKPVVLNDPAQNRSALGHERTHFDLTELHARRMRRHFAGLDDPCNRSDGVLNAVARRFIQEEKEEQRRYDGETGNGLRDQPQAAWTQDVTRRLAALGAYAR